LSLSLHPYIPPLIEACKHGIAFMPILIEGLLAKFFDNHNIKSGSCNKNILYISFVVLISCFFISLLFLPLSAPSHAVSWYARVGSWQIDRSGETVNFTMEEYCLGNITEIKATPRGLEVEGIHSRYVNIDLNNVGVKQRRSALAGEIKSEEYTNISAEAEEPITRDILKRSGSPYYEFNFTELWPVHYQSERALIYSGTMINDLDLTKNNLDWASTSFRRSTQLSAIRSYKMDLENLNISLLADNDDVLQVEFLPNKSLNYSIHAFSSGLTELSYAQTASDMASIVSRGEEIFFGDYTLIAAINMSASNKNATIVA